MSIYPEARRQWLKILTSSIEKISPKTAESHHIGIIGALGSGDVGDEAMLCALKTELTDAFPNARFKVFSCSPARTEAYVGIPCVPTAHDWLRPRHNPLGAAIVIVNLVEQRLGSILPFLRKRNEVDRDGHFARRVYIQLITAARRLAVRQLRERKTQSGNGTLKEHMQNISDLDCLIYLGGGYINSWNTKADSYLYLLSASVAQELGIPVYGTGINLGPFSVFDLKHLAPVLGRFELIGMRDDDESFLNLRAMGIFSNEKHHFSNDDANGLKPESNPALDQLVAELGPFISLHVHYWKLSETEWGNFSYKLSEAVDDLITRTGRKILMLPMIFGERRENFDARALQEIALLCKHKDRIQMAPDNLSPSQIKSLYARADGALVTRHHSMVFSVSSGVPTVALYFDTYYRQKIIGVAKEYGTLCVPLDAHVCTTEQITSSLTSRMRTEFLVKE